MKDIGVNVEYVQRCDAPTREVFITRKSNGERYFEGFRHDPFKHSDCFISSDKLPLNLLHVSKILNVTIFN